MKREARLTAVLDLLAEQGSIEVDELVRRLGVSSATARRDLDALASERLLTRTRGGATGELVAYDLPTRYKTGQQAPAKRRIAEVASEMVPGGAVVGLCGGTTTTAIASALGSRADLLIPSPFPNLTVVTNAINIAALLVMRPQIKTVLTGGVVQSRSYELVGPYTDLVLNRITMDISFIGVNGMHPDFGFTVHDESEASVNALIASRATRSVVVADSTKVGRKAFATLGGMNGPTTIITDEGITPAQVAAFEDKGIEVIIA
jgi:DeoR family transcriptional regulator of aga operon